MASSPVHPFFVAFLWGKARQSAPFVDDETGGGNLSGWKGGERPLESSKAAAANAPDKGESYKGGFLTTGGKSTSFLSSS